MNELWNGWYNFCEDLVEGWTGLLNDIYADWFSDSE